jgi:hypothetical protein
VAADPTSDLAEQAADVLARSRTVIDAHLEHEEQAVEPLLAEHEDDPEWKAAAKKLRPGTMADTGRSLAWMQDGAGARERDGLKAAIPGPVLSVITALFGRRYRREVAPTWQAGPQ